MATYELLTHPKKCDRLTHRPIDLFSALTYIVL